MTRHGQGVIYLAGLVLAETMLPAPIAIRGAATPSKAAMSALANPSCSPGFGRSAFKPAATSAVALVTKTGRKPKTP